MSTRSWRLPRTLVSMGMLVVASVTALALVSTAPATAAVPVPAPPATGNGSSHGTNRTPPSTAADGLTFSATIGFSGGVPVGGWANLSIFSDGSYNFSGQFHDSGFPSYDTGIVWVFRASNGTAFVFSDGGHVAGTIGSGSRDHFWNASGTNAAIAAAWPAIQQGWNWRWEARVSLDLGGIFSSIASLIGPVTTFITVVGPLL
jgi:hypothetical protein